MGPKINPDLEAMAKILNDVITKKFKAQERLVLSQEPTLVKNDIVEYDKKLKVSALDKFNNPGYVAAGNYYLSEKDLAAKKTCGAVVLYILEADIGTFLKAFEYTNFDDENPEEIIPKCYEFGKVIGKEFQQALSANGYVNLCMSEPLGNRNSLPLGVDFSYDQYDKYEISYFVGKIKILVAELTMTIVPKK